jgi:DNA-binding response OmpR family regulator
MSKFKKILVVEDDVFISELYIRAIRKAGYDVTHAPAGNSGLEEGLSGKYDLMLLDIMIPDMTGVEVLKKLREQKYQVPNMKIVITTNLEQEESTREAVEALADGYIIKADITPKILVKMIGQLEEAGKIEQIKE